MFKIDRYWSKYWSYMIHLWTWFSSCPYFRVIQKWNFWDHFYSMLKKITIYNDWYWSIYRSYPIHLRTQSSFYNFILVNPIIFIASYCGRKKRCQTNKHTDKRNRCVDFQSHTQKVDLRNRCRFSIAHPQKWS